MDISFNNDRRFYEEQLQGDKSWMLPLNIAVAMHLAVFAGAVMLPDLFEHRPLIDQIVTVDLVSMPELPAPPLPKAPDVQPSAPPPAAVKEVEPVAEKPPEAAVSLAPSVSEMEQPAPPAKIVSLKPRKHKIRKAKDTRLAEEKEREKRLKEHNEAVARKKAEDAKRKREQQIARQKAEKARKRAEQVRRQKAIAEARRIQREADLLAVQAREDLAAVIRTTGPGTVSHSSGTSRNSGGQNQSVIEQQYLASLYDQVRSYWILPEMRKWNQSLQTVVVLIIRRNGTIQDMQIERKSGDQFFDQFVLKTLQSASPMPRFPAILTKPTLEVGLVFKPGELGM